ncbi:MAG: hypothetical protein U5K30_14090 [Acidimicrobiales bacterium]|nr:hypothetical protein [Acidimicrobiales bacterium]
MDLFLEHFTVHDDVWAASGLALNGLTSASVVWSGGWAADST